MAESETRLLVGGLSAAGHPIDVLISDGIIISVGPPADVFTDRRVGDPEPEFARSHTKVTDLRGYVVLAAPVEPHAHLDKALLAGRVPNLSYDLDGAITAVKQAYPSMTPDDIEDRATRAVLAAVAHGCLTIRSHADCEARIGAGAVEGLLRARKALHDVVTLQVVALAGHPIAGKDGAANRESLAAAMAAGADLVGGAPSLESDPAAAIRELLAVAVDAGCAVDVHTDETTDPAATSLLDLARAVSTVDLPGGVTASHCVSLGMQSPDDAVKIAREVAAAGINIVTLPQTNLYLQGRSAKTRTPRGLTAIGVLRDAGVVVAGGGDNMRDPFNPMGSADPLETAMLLVVAGHMSPEDAYAAVSEHAHIVLGEPAMRIEPGAPADLVAIRGESLADVLASRTQDRLVIRGGRLLARTTVTHEWLADGMAWAGPPRTPQA